MHGQNIESCREMDIFYKFLQLFLHLFTDVYISLTFFADTFVVLNPKFLKMGGGYIDPDHPMGHHK